MHTDWVSCISSHSRRGSRGAHGHTTASTTWSRGSSKPWACAQPARSGRRLGRQACKVSIGVTLGLHCLHTLGAALGGRQARARTQLAGKLHTLCLSDNHNAISVLRRCSTGQAYRVMQHSEALPPPEAPARSHRRETDAAAESAGVFLHHTRRSAAWRSCAPMRTTSVPAAVHAAGMPRRAGLRHGWRGRLRAQRPLLGVGGLVQQWHGVPVAVAERVVQHAGHGVRTCAPRAPPSGMGLLACARFPGHCMAPSWRRGLHLSRQ